MLLLLLLLLRPRVMGTPATALIARVRRRLAEHGRHPLVRFQACALMQEALVKEWALMDPAQLASIRNYLLHAIGPPLRWLHGGIASGILSSPLTPPRACCAPLRTA
jgi:hypothetical protein